MLSTAVTAEMPLIQVSTTDMLNVREVLLHLIPDVAFVSGIENILKHDTAKVGVFLKDVPNINYHVAYERLLEEGKSAVFVNPTKTIPIAFNAGEIPIPSLMITKILGDAGYSVREAERLLPALGNLTLKEVGEVCKFAQVEFGNLTAQGIHIIKRKLFSESQGLILVDPYQEFYFPDKRLDLYLDKERWFFLECSDSRLVPRGLLLHGDAGVGKSQAAKYFAQTWGLSLYLMDLSSIMGKYMGQSEQGMRSMLAKIDQEAPAILLIDEVEKLFKSDGDSGTTSRLLGQLLWWLAEHRSRVFTMMTSNDITALPPELYRPGRLDELIELEGLTYEEGLGFIEKVNAQFEGGYALPNIAPLYGLATKQKISHALLVKAVKDAIKTQYNTKE